TQGIGLRPQPWAKFWRPVGPRRPNAGSAANTYAKGDDRSLFLPRPVDRNTYIQPKLPSKTSGKSPRSHRQMTIEIKMDSPAQVTPDAPSNRPAT
ncbi:MAG: hypothetical protein ACREIC_31755, partial [Limisphaerales bacterium]